MTARFFADLALVPGASVILPDHAARHVQVLRLQPGDAITLFNGQGSGGEGEFAATVTRMGRSDVEVTVGAFSPTSREMKRPIHIAMGIPANERMDWLVEKATELGVASIQPLMTERTVLRLKGERADKKVAHWRGVAIAACEQCGRNRVPDIHPISNLQDWLKTLPAPAADEAGHRRLILSLRASTQALSEAAGLEGALTFLSGPEGGLNPAEETAAITSGFAAVTLGPRVLRAETAPLACLARLGLD